MSSGDNVSRAQRGGVTSIAAGAALVIDARHCRNLTIITGAGATATYSRVDSPTAIAHVSGAENGGTVAATTKLVTVVDWPWYRIDSAGGTTRVGIV